MLGETIVGKYLDEYVVGEEYVSPSRTITETDVVMFAAMTGDYNEIHTSVEFTKANNFGQRVVHGLLCLSISHGLLFRLGLLESTAIAILAVDDWRFKAPVFIGDTIVAKFKVLETIPSSKDPSRGVLKLLTQIIKQDGTIAQEGVKVLMMKKH
jgi:acyl dehydratase